MQRIVTLVGWSGHLFNLMPGDPIDCPDDVAEARIKAGIARAATDDERRRESVVALAQPRSAPQEAEVANAEAADGDAEASDNGEVQSKPPRRGAGAKEAQ